MAYINPRPRRAGLSGLGGFFDTVGDLLKGGLTAYGQHQQAIGAQNALAQQTPVVAAPAPSSGVSTTTLAIGGLAVAGIAIILLKRKK